MSSRSKQRRASRHNAAKARAADDAAIHARIMESRRPHKPLPLHTGVQVAGLSPTLDNALSMYLRGDGSVLDTLSRRHGARSGQAVRKASPAEQAGQAARGMRAASWRTMRTAAPDRDGGYLHQVQVQRARVARRALLARAVAFPGDPADNPHLALLYPGAKVPSDGHLARALAEYAGARLGDKARKVRRPSVHAIPTGTAPRRRVAPPTVARPDRLAQYDAETERRKGQRDRWVRSQRKKI